MPPNKKPRLNMDWFDDVVLVATEGPKFTKVEIVANEVKRYVSEPLSTVDPLTPEHLAFSSSIATLRSSSSKKSMRVATLACIHFHPDFFPNAYR
jgi:hypothetical protein